MFEFIALLIFFIFYIHIYIYFFLYLLAVESLYLLTFCFDIVPLHNSQDIHICHERYIFHGSNMASDKQLNKTNTK